jgi:hypothetical protein
MKADLRCLLYLLQHRLRSSPLAAKLRTPFALSLGVHLLLLLLLGAVVVVRRETPAPKNRIEVVAFPLLTEESRPVETAAAAPAPSSTPDPAARPEPPVSKLPPSPLPGRLDGLPLPTPDPAALYASYLAGGEDGQFNFFGLSPRGQRIVFVIDISGSMLQKTGPHTRLSLAMREIKRAIGRLEPSQQFSVVLFAETLAFFRLAPVAATRENKLACFRFLDTDPNLGGSTNLEDGLVKALGMKPDVILLLTDGEANTPSRGILAQARFLREKFNRRMQIHSIGYFLEPGSSPELMLKTLSEENNGVYRRWNPAG